MRPSKCEPSPALASKEVEQDQAHQGHARHSVDQAVPADLPEELLRQLRTTDRCHGEASEEHAAGVVQGREEGEGWS